VAGVPVRMAPPSSRTCSSSQRSHGYICATSCVPAVNGPCGIEPLTTIRATPWSGMNPMLIAFHRSPQLWVSDQS
jgi:hypothetical protein